MKRRSTKSALLSAVMALVICFTALVGTTFAWFTDSVTSANNIIKAGNLDVEMYWADGTQAVPTDDAGWTDASTGAIFDYDNWEPGYMQVRHIKIANEGTLALKYKVLIVANGVVSDLADVIDVYYVDPAVQVAERDGLANVTKLGTLTNVLAALGETGVGVLAANTADTVTIALKMQESAGNEYQKKSIGSNFSIQLIATQATVEADSFDNSYDAEAPYAVEIQGAKEASTNLDLRSDDMALRVPASAPAGNYVMTISNKSQTTNANGETTLSLDINLEKDGVKVEAAEGVQYLVSFTVGTGLNVTGVTHNGVAVTDFTYYALTGKLQFYTSSFSPFSVTYTQAENLNPEAQYMASGVDIHKSTNQSGTFQLISDVQTSKYGDNGRYGYGYEYIIRNQADYTLDLNGKTLIHDTVNENANKNAFTYTLVANHAGTKLTIDGEGKVISHNSAGYTCAVQGKDGTLITVNGGDFEVTNGIAVWAGAGSHIVINGGSFVNSGATTSHELIYSSGGVIDIYGGFFHNTDGNYTLNVEDRNRATSAINVYGGTYVNFDPSTGGQDPNNIKVAEGYTVISEIQANGDVWYTVVPVQAE